MDFTKAGSPSIGAVISSSSSSSRSTSNSSPITSLSYHENGQRLFATSTTESKLHIIDCLNNGKLVQPSLKNEIDGISIVEATHHENNVLCTGSSTSSSKNDNKINYWSVYDNKIIRTFTGHTNTITSIAMSPVDDTFLTSSIDRTVRLWNISSPTSVPSASISKPLGEMILPIDIETNNTLTSYDSTGLVFAISASTNNNNNNNTVRGHHVHLYDARNYNAGAFSELVVTHTDIEKQLLQQVQQQQQQQSSSFSPIDNNTIQQQSKSEWTSLNFNLSGSQILVGNSMGLSILLDGYEGTVQKVFPSQSTSSVTQQQQQQRRSTVHCITPDDKVLLQGNDDGTISCWDIDNSTILKTLSGHTGSITNIKSNPKYAQFASSCTQTALWIW